MSAWRTTQTGQALIQAAGQATASAASTVSSSKTMWGSQILYAGHDTTPQPRRGQAAGGIGRPPAPPSTR